MEFLNIIWIFFQDQILGMKFLNLLIGDVLSVAGVDIGGRLGGSIQFFLYDVVKITILLCLLIFMISYIQSYFPPERSKKILGKFDGIGANVISALLGTVTPFCSCSSIPLFIGFTSAGLPLGVTFSFLISSPMVDLGSLVLLMSIFGAKVAAAYVILGLVIAEALGKYLASDVFESYSAGTETKPQINQDAVRLMKEIYQIDMEETQYSKLLSDIPPVDIVITMGCNVNCPTVSCRHREDWGLEDPTGKSDEEFQKTIKLIDSKIMDLANRIKVDFITQSVV